MLDRRLGLKAIIAVLVVTFAVLAAVTQLIAKDPDKPDGNASVTPAPTACVEASDPYGTAPDGFKYEKVDEATREKTVKALRLDEAGGRVDMRAARRAGLTLGTLVGVPSPDPAAYVQDLVESVQSGGAPVDAQEGLFGHPAQRRHRRRGRRPRLPGGPDQRAGPDGRAVPRRRGVRFVMSAARPG